MVGLQNVYHNTHVVVGIGASGNGIVCPYRRTDYEEHAEE